VTEWLTPGRLYATTPAATNTRAGRQPFPHSDDRLRARPGYEFVADL
jgi:hypothetical protein